MKRRLWYKLHKWIAVSSGAVLLVWCASGVVMMLPNLFSSVSPLIGPLDVGETADYSQLGVSPRQALEALDEPVERLGVQYMTLVKVGDRIAYDVKFWDDSHALVDAGSGEPFMVDSTLAVSLARIRSGSGAEVAQFERIESNTANYPFGSVPAYSLAFADDPSVVLSVSIKTGAVDRMGTAGRIRGMIERTHTLTPLVGILGAGLVHWLIVAFGGLVAVATVLGFWIALPRSWWPSGSAQSG